MVRCKFLNILPYRRFSPGYDQCQHSRSSPEQRSKTLRPAGIKPIISGMKVTIIVLSYNNYEDTAECLDSLATLDYPDYTVTVIDNGSTDDSARKLKVRFPDYRFILNKANLGYAEGNNVGLRQAP